MPEEKAAGITLEPCASLLSSYRSVVRSLNLLNFTKTRLTPAALIERMRLIRELHYPESKYSTAP
jgi:hypothetical protein